MFPFDVAAFFVEKVKCCHIWSIVALITIVNWPQKWFKGDVQCQGTFAFATIAWNKTKKSQQMGNQKFYAAIV